MLWYKSWLDTKWRFAIGLAVLLLSAGGTVLGYPRLLQMMPVAAELRLEGEVGRRIGEAIELSREYRGHVWRHWFAQEMSQQWTLFAVLLGTGGLLSQASRGGGLFTLSLPVSRQLLLAIRAATGLAELLVLALLPSLAIALLSPAIAQSYSPVEALVHAICMFVGGSVLFSLTFLLSTVFDDLWRPPLIVLCVAVVVGLAETVFRDVWPYSLFAVMRGESYFRAGLVPWFGLLASAAVSAGLLYGAARNIERHDF
jgi:ABC-type transport system involved in multi-copper enzyme maturation permease subunit